MSLRSLLAAALAAVAPTTAPLPPLHVAAHQHLLSPATAKLLGVREYDAAALLADMDRAGARRGVVLSMAYTFADDRKHVPDPDAAVTRENNWTSQQIVAARGRLIGFCGVNPLRAAAEAELTRCAGLPGMRGLKLHFGNSGVSLRDPAQATTLTRLFALADRLSLPIVIHLRARGGQNYGAEDARLFVTNLLAAAPHVPVQVAHLGGGGADPPDAPAGMAGLTDALRRPDPPGRHQIFDLTSGGLPETSATDGAAAAATIRAVGTKRMLFGSDLPVGGNPALREAWADFLATVPLTRAEQQAIGSNRPPYR